MRRRRLLVGMLVAIAVVYVTGAMVLLRGGGAPSASALPLHPVAWRFVPDDTQIGECASDSCFEQAFGNIAFRDGPRAALALVGKVYGDGGSAGCHRVAHAIGAAALTRYHGNVSRTFAEGSSICWSGYYHGVLERSLLKVKSYGPGPLGTVARSLCRDAMEHMTGWLAWQCLHGLGHGLMLTTGSNLPLALAVCRRLAGWWEQDVCKSGVFMENLQPSFGSRSRWLRADDPVYPCTVVRHDDKRRCYQMVTSNILPTVEGDWEQTAATCARVESEFVPVCFGSMGRDASARTNRDPRKIAEICGIARRYEEEKSCIAAAAMDMTANFTSGARAKPLCLVVRDRVRDNCYFGIGVVMSLFRKNPDSRLADCRSLTTVPRLVGECVRGGRSTFSRI